MSHLKYYYKGTPINWITSADFDPYLKIRIGSVSFNGEQSKSVSDFVGFPTGYDSQEYIFKQMDAGSVGAQIQFSNSAPESRVNIAERKSTHNKDIANNYTTYYLDFKTAGTTTNISLPDMSYFNRVAFVAVGGGGGGGGSGWGNKDQNGHSGGGGASGQLLVRGCISLTNKTGNITVVVGSGGTGGTGGPGSGDQDGTLGGDGNSTTCTIDNYTYTAVGGGGGTGGNNETGGTGGTPKLILTATPPPSADHTFLNLGQSGSQNNETNGGQGAVVNLSSLSGYSPLVPSDIGPLNGETTDGTHATGFGAGGNGGGQMNHSQGKGKSGGNGSGGYVRLYFYVL